jgi:hypothetical protein
MNPFLFVRPFMTYLETLAVTEIVYQSDGVITEFERMRNKAVVALI